MLRSVTEFFHRIRDRLRRRIAICLWDRPNLTHGPFQNRIVFVRWDAKLGDTIVLSWVFRELKRQRPDLELTVITGQSFEDLFRHGYGIESVYLAGKRHGSTELKRIAQQIKHPRYVVHLSLKWRPRDIRFIRQLEPAHVVGLDDELKCVDIKLGQLTRGRHFSEKLVPWLDDLGVDTTNRRYWIPRLPQAQERVGQWWPEGRVVGLCPFGASRKKCLNEQWIELIVQSLLAKDFKVVFLVLPSEHSFMKQLIDRNRWHGQVFINKGQSSQYDLFEQVARCDAVVSVDTAVVHLAVGFQTPLLAVYNSVGEEFENWHPNADRVSLLRAVSGQGGSVNSLDKVSLQSSISSFALDLKL
jgi:ADP-heptose:LPS heptosyltransferase